MEKVILGIHDGHSSSVSIVLNGKLIFAASEERYTRVKDQCGFPYSGINSALIFCKNNNFKIDKIAIAGKFSSAFFRIIDKFYRKRKISSPYDRTSKIAMYYQTFLCNIKIISLIDNIISKFILKMRLSSFKLTCDIELVEHHIAHAMTTAEKNCAIFTMDAFGDGRSGIIGKLNKNKIKIFKSFKTFGSLAYAYGLFTHCFGFKEGQEGKLMGLASYGKTLKYNKILKYLVKFSNNNVFLNPVIENKHFKKWLFKNKTVSFAKSIENIVNLYIKKLSEHACELTKTDSICVSGGLFLNVSSNSAILNSKIKKLYLFPNAGDGGLSFGAARYLWFKENKK